MDSKTLARYIREQSLRMVSRANASHIGGALSVADVLAVLYADVLRYRADDPSWAGRDRLLLSKGHCCVALYAALAATGFFPEERLTEYGTDGTDLLCHVSHVVPGVEFSFGSLGHGLPVAVGIALAARVRGEAHRVFVIVGDGELDEGSNWEALMFAAAHRLDNLRVIVDRNGQQAMGDTEDVLPLEPLGDKLRAFGARVLDVDGHDHDALRAALIDDAPNELRTTNNERPGSPTVIIAHTVKGRGVPFMENKLKWHYSAPDAELLDKALEGLQA